MADILNGHSSHREMDPIMPPGTFLLVRESKDHEHNGKRIVMLDPVPSKDPNEPLNWSTTRKTVNYTLVLAVTCLIFTALSIQVVFWQLMVEDMSVTYTQLNWAVSINFVGLAVGCVFFIPFARKFGRRPIYIVSTALMLVTSFWSGEMKTLWELYVNNLIQGLAGATNETIVQMTIADLFFVHDRGRMNGLYMAMVMIGSFLTPMGAGTQATKETWRWSYRTLGIFNAVILILFIIFYEETKYCAVIEGVTPSDGSTAEAVEISVGNLKDDPKGDDSSKDDDKNDYIQPQATTKEPSSTYHQLDHTIPLASWKKRLAWITPTSESILPYYLRPIFVLSYPAVVFTGIQYAAGVAWLTILSNVLSIVFAGAPYNFTSEQIGFMGTGPFIGNLFGSFYGGYLGDRSILYYARKNRGYFEPEMRLYILHLPALSMCAGLIMFGVTTAKGMHWMLPSVGGALFGFGLGGISDPVLTLVIDSHYEVVGDAFTAIAFIRNAVSIGIPFAITPWLARNGIQNMFIACGFMSLAISGLCIPMIMYGKRFRAKIGKQFHQDSPRAT